MSAEKNAGRVVDLRARLERVPMPEDGPPAITFGWDEGAPVTFRDMATLDAFTQEAIAEALLEAADDVRVVRLEGLPPDVDSHPTSELFEAWLRDRATRILPPAEGDA